MSSNKREKLKTSIPRKRVLSKEEVEKKLLFMPLYQAVVEVVREKKSIKLKEDQLRQEEIKGSHVLVKVIQKPSVTKYNNFWDAIEEGQYLLVDSYAFKRHKIHGVLEGTFEVCLIEENAIIMAIVEK